MELKEFVAETLLAIITGVKEAQARADEQDARVNPTGLMRGTASVANNAIWDNRDNNYAQPVSFDIALTTEDKSEGGAKIKVLSGILGGEIGGDKGSRSSVASRVQFVVPVLLPTHDVGDPSARIAGLRKT